MNDCKHEYIEIVEIRTGMLPFYMSTLIQCKICKEVKLKI